MYSKDGLFQALDQLMPLHAVADFNGQIVHVGPTLAKLIGQRRSHRMLSDLFRVIKPKKEHGFQDLQGLAGRTLMLELRLEQPEVLKAHCVVLGDKLIFALSFGFTIVDAVRRFGLSDSDFAATDQTIGMLYLSEAYALSLGEFRNLSLRLEGAKRLAEVEAHTDALTGLFNRRGLDAALRDLQQSGQEFAIMQIDLDHFKQVNDGLGHAAGDGVLTRVAEILTLETRKHDLVSRNGGDEFTIVLADVTDRATAEEIGDRIVERIKQPMTLPQGECRVSASVGTAFSFSQNTRDVEALIEKADASLYQSKSDGRGRQTLHV